MDGDFFILEGGLLWDNRRGCLSSTYVYEKGAVHMVVEGVGIGGRRYFIQLNGWVSSWKCLKGNF